MSEQKEEITLALIGQKLDGLQKTVDGHIEKMNKKIYYYDKMQVEFGIFKWITGICAMAFIMQIVIAITKQIFKGG